MYYEHKRTPLHNLPITLTLTALEQKQHRRLHCMECGKPFLDIVDKVVTATDGAIPFNQLVPNEKGYVEPHCWFNRCKQFYHVAL